MLSKKVKTFVSVALLGASIMSVTSQAEANGGYTVQKGDSIWKIAQQYDVSIEDIQQVNQLSTDVIYPGQSLSIPDGYTASELSLLARLVNAEAKGESYAGKVAVATVVLNRVNSNEFPNTISGVINEVVGGAYAFTPVLNGAINEAADEESKKAVKEAVAMEGQGLGSLYFYNPATSTSDWVFSRETTTTIGNHRFAK
ncbi:cell wall hydrolase [Bacillus fonticola]|uniref:cell wall hydrolase n=1 Tax=Bacillus fonticola TaxID=2728853 RepID=UPI0014756416|nr:cell wall hydrolase [Bacillus fonticola]